jgi:hypothetical protein
MPKSIRTHQEQLADMKPLPNGYTVYCDESRHDGQERNPYMAIGGLWVATSQKQNLIKQLRGILSAHGLGAEVKWTKTSERCLPAYKAIVDFFATQDFHFRAIVVEQRKTDNHRFNQGDAELGFYKFYYEMLVKWLNQPVAYNLLLDFKTNKGANHYSVLERCLKAKVPTGTTISGVHVIDSADSPLAQMADLLTGAVAASWCGFSGASPKAQLASYIARKTGRSSLVTASVGPGFTKFNIFKIDLR